MLLIDVLKLRVSRQGKHDHYCSAHPAGTCLHYINYPGTGLERLHPRLFLRSQMAAHLELATNDSGCYWERVLSPVKSQSAACLP